MAKRGRAARNKGLSFERDVVRALRPYFPKARRHLEFQGGDQAVGIDIANTGLFKIQCKKYRQYVSVNTIEEVLCERAFGEIPVLVTAADHKPAMVILEFEDFLRILEMPCIIPGKRV